MYPTRLICITAGHNRLLWIPTPPHLAAIYKPDFFFLSHFTSLHFWWSDSYVKGCLASLTTTSKLICPGTESVLSQNTLEFFFSLSPLHALIAATECHSRGAEHRLSTERPTACTTKPQCKQGIKRIDARPVLFLLLWTPAQNFSVKWKRNMLRKKKKTHETSRLRIRTDSRKVMNEWEMSQKWQKSFCFRRGYIFPYSSILKKWSQLLSDIFNKVDNKRRVH